MTRPAESSGEATRILNAFQRDARAMFEQLLPALHRPGVYPNAAVDGWGDARGGRSTASTVVLACPKWLKPQERTKQLARLRLEVSERNEWTLIVSVVAQPVERRGWPPRRAEEVWWADRRERVRTQILEYHRAKP